MILEKSWGLIKTYVSNQTCTVKLLLISPGKSTSLHSHRLRDDMWIVLDDGLQVVIGDEVFEPKAGDEFVIPAGVKHRISAREVGRVLEIDFGYTMEEDICYFEPADSVEGGE
ncbi:MAG: cupin domain-containing protein [Actinomycetota bacterium]|nr:cupin domain-containing protein [Actinomycetota bacterium]